MQNPKFIRVNGHVYQLRNETLHHPRFIRVGGKVYRLDQLVDPKAPRPVIARLTHEEEIELGHLAQAGDIDARNKLIAATLRLVVKIAYELAGYDKSKVQDLIQQGNLGLIDAAKKFDPDRGARFSTFAAYYIKSKIKKFIVRDRNLVSIKQGDEERVFYRLRRVERELQDQGIEPTDEAVAKELKVKPSLVRDMRPRIRGQEGSLYSMGPDGEETTMDVEDHSLRPDRIFEEHEFSARFNEVKDAFAATLKGKDLKLFLERIVADEDKVRTLQQFADDYGVTREAVRIWERALKNKFQTYINEAFGVGIQLTACLRAAKLHAVKPGSVKAPVLPRVIRVSGRLYRLAQNAELLVNVVNAGENAEKLFKTLLTLTKNSNVQAALQKGLVAIQKFNTSLASATSPEDYAKCFKDNWSTVKSMLTKYAEAFTAAKQTKVAEALAAISKSLDSSIKALTAAEGLDFVGKELGGEQQKPTVDWGDADKSDAKPEPVRASVLPRLIRHDGHLYRLILI